MKLYHAALAFGLLSLTHAAPTPDIFARQDPYAALCSLKPDDPSYWKDYNMQWFIQTEAHAQAIEAHVTAPNDPAKKRSFHNLLAAQLPNSRWQCTSDMPSCELEGLDCTARPRVVMAIKATIYYLNYLRTAVKMFTEAAVEVDTGLAGMQAKYNPSTQSKLAESDSALSTTTSIVGAIAGLMPGTGGMLSSAVLSISSSAMDLFAAKAENKLDAKFDGFTELSKMLHESIKMITQALNRRIQDIFTLTPPKTPAPPSSAPADNDVLPPLPDGPRVGWNTDPGYTPNVIADGAFAVSRNTDWVHVQNTMKTSLYSQALNYLWKKEGVIVFRISKKSLNVDPCDPAEPDMLFNRNVKWCDESGNMHVLQARPTIGKIYSGDRAPIDPVQYSVPGFGDVLEEFGIRTKDVMSSSWYFQGKLTRTADEATKILEDYGKRGATDTLAFFDLQTCDLDKVPDLNWNGAYCTKESQGLELAYCTLYARLDYCRDLDRGVGEDGQKLVWPWAPFEYSWDR